MATYVLKNCQVMLGEYDLSGDTNSLALSYETEMKDATTFGSKGAREKKAGLLDIKAELGGLWDSGIGGLDQQLYEAIGMQDTVMTVCPTDGAVGKTALMTRVLEASYSPGAKVGDLLEFSTRAEGRGILARGQVLLNGVYTETGTTEPVRLGKVLGDQRLYVALHVVGYSGSTRTLKVRLQSSPDSAFTAPIDRVIFDTVTTVRAIWQEVPASVTDEWWRVQYTIQGTNPSFAFLVAAAIQ